MPGYLQPIREVVQYIHNTLIGSQTDPKVIKYTGIRQDEGLPYPEDHACQYQPVQIIRLKKLGNALYTLDKKLDDLENGNVFSRVKSHFSIKQDIEAICHEIHAVLISFNTETRHVFTPDMNTLLSCLSVLYLAGSHVFTPAASVIEITRSPSISKHAGLVTGHVIDQLKPVDFLTRLAGNLSRHIYSINQTIKTHVLKIPRPSSTISMEQITSMLNKKSAEWSDTIHYARRDPLSFVMAMPAAIEQINPLLEAILLETTELSDTLQEAIRLYLTTLKYGILTRVFSFTDKLELQFLRNPGELSVPLMAEIKPLYATIIQYTGAYLDLSGKDRHLAYIEDARFIELRLEPVHEGLLDILNSPDNPLNNPDNLFRIERFEATIASVYEHANMFVFPLDEADNIFERPEYINMSNDNTLDVSQYDIKRQHRLQCTEFACDQLLEALKTLPGQNPITFQPDYVPCLLRDKTARHERNTLYVNIEENNLVYEIHQASKPRILHLSPLAGVLQAGHTDCYIWDATIRQLAYIAPDGQLHKEIPLQDQRLVSAFILLKKWYMKTRKNLALDLPVNLSANTIATLITSNSDHQPDLVQTGTIPLEELHCRLTSLQTIDDIMPCLPRIYSTLLERGHIQDETLSRCIRWYSVVQPCLIAAYQNNREIDIHALDQAVVDLFSGHIEKHKDNTPPSLSVKTFATTLHHLKTILAEKQTVPKKIRHVKATRSEENSHRKYSEYVTELEQAISLFHGKLAHAWQQALKPAQEGIPYPEISGQDTISNIFSLISDTKNIVKALSDSMPCFRSTEKKKHHPRQVDTIKRITNLVYYLKQAVLEAEKEQEHQSMRWMLGHLALCGYEIYLLINTISTDPDLSVVYQDLLSGIKNLYNSLTGEYQQYVPAPAENTSLLHIINIVKMFPERLLLEESTYNAKLDELKASSRQAAENMERILNNHSQSISYPALFLDLPVIVNLLHEICNSLLHFSRTTNDTLLKTIPAKIKEIINKADGIEINRGIHHGTLSDPVQQIMSEFYAGLITPLILNIDKRIELQCDESLLHQRVNTVQKHLDAVKRKKEEHEKAIQSMDNILNHCPANEDLELLKKTLNGTHLYLMTIEQARKNDKRDCLIWNRKTLEMVHIHSDGRETPVQLKNTWEIIRFIKTKISKPGISSITLKKEPAPEICVYLYEHEIIDHISAYSDFVLKQRGVSIPDNTKTLEHDQHALAQLCKEHYAISLASDELEIDTISEKILSLKKLQRTHAMSHPVIKNFLLAKDAEKKIKAVNIVLRAFHHYLNDAEQQWTTQNSLFESPSGIQAKRAILNQIQQVIDSDDTSPGKINRIKTALVQEGVMDTLLNYSQHEPNYLVKLCELVLRIFEAAGLYTPAVQLHVDQLFGAVEKEPLPAPAKTCCSFLFFSRPERTHFKTRVDELKIDLGLIARGI